MRTPMYNTTLRPYRKDKHMATVATQNFLAAFGVYLAEEQGWDQERILDAFSKIDKIMDRDDNGERLEELAGIRLMIKG